MTKVFISYRADNEGTQYKKLLVAWSLNPHRNFFDFKFEDQSIGTSINSTDAYYIKSRIKDKIDSSDKIICLVGENTSTSDWVNWELEYAHSLGKPIAAIKIKNSYKTPINLYGVNATWAKSFTFDSIKKAIDDAN
ncbi:TIR domain-containing protein [Macrococcoides bohemicum]|uniref:TIR domain-containing protein n=1 Tax=Macrococcoides bohemicum TaxID=1903056 RepID=UPI001F0FF580|nr:TIR domain-containing protein [Macrococcus bohemicus]